MTCLTRQARVDLADNDLGRVIIYHPGLRNLIDVQLQRQGNLNAQTVVELSAKVQYSRRLLRKVDLDVESQIFTGN